ncbi:MAG TPA: dihydrofolate reductase family protein [Rectinemataceae bacterium]|nr:dihydrofolate reductase family protein [Rectinemataceae bacterium]
MRKLIVGEFISLDGVIQAPGGENEDTDGGFTQGAWTRPYWHDDIGGYFAETLKDCHAFLLGRKTWTTHGQAFNSLPPGDSFGDMMNDKTKYVVSTTLSSAELWRNSKIIAGDVVEEVRKIKSQDGKNIYLDGSSVLAHTLFEADLVDSLHLLLYPVILGRGKKLFPEGMRHNLSLIEHRAFPTGVVLLRYGRS